MPEDPNVVERIEVVRGPAALLYGGNAIGGVVNSFDNRIPSEPVDGIHGQGELRYGGITLHAGDSFGVSGVDTLACEVADTTDVFLVETAMLDSARIRAWEAAQADDQH